MPRIAGMLDGQYFAKGDLGGVSAYLCLEAATQGLGTCQFGIYDIEHRHDLMHKAVGGMLREAGAINREALRGFLAKFHKRLPRTALRYAIEHMDADERKRWMKSWAVIIQKGKFMAPSQVSNDVLVVLISEYADWEPSILCPGLRRGFGLWEPRHVVKTVAPDGSPW